MNDKQKLENLQLNYVAYVYIFKGALAADGAIKKQIRRIRREIQYFLFI